MGAAGLRLARFMRTGAPVHAVAVAEDGRHLLAASERDLRLLDRPGHVRYCLGEPGTPPNGGERPFNALAMAPDFSVGLAGERAGRLHRLAFSAGASPEPAVEIWNEPNDLYTVSLAVTGHGSGGAGPTGGIAVIGHLGPALSALDLAGRPLWRHHPADGTGTEGRSWTVAVGGDMAYAGSSGGRQYSLMALEAATGLARSSRASHWPVTLVAARGDRPGVIAGLTRGSLSEIHAYAADLSGPQWRYRPEPGEVLTAVAACGELVALGTNTGFVHVLRAATGKLVVRQDLLFASTVLSLGLAGRCCRPDRQPGRTRVAGGNGPDAVLVAGLTNGLVAYLVDEPARHAPRGFIEAGAGAGEWVE